MQWPDSTWHVLFAHHEEGIIIPQSTRQQQHEASAGKGKGKV